MGMDVNRWPSLIVGGGAVHSSRADNVTRSLVFSPEFCSIYIGRYAASNRDERRESGE